VAPRSAHAIEGEMDRMFVQRFAYQLIGNLNFSSDFGR
jgi:hypothetical protein